MSKKDKEYSEIDDIIKDYSKEIEYYGSVTTPKQKITTSSFWFDCTLEGGFSVGSWSNFCGAEESGKTSMALCWARNWQKAFPEDGFVLYFNAEGRLTEERITKSQISCDPKHWRRIDTNKAEAIYGISERTIRLGKHKVFIIVDSMDAMEAKEDTEKEISLAGFALSGAKLNAMAGRRLSILAHTGPHHVFMCSQLRDKINSPHPMAQQSGGHAPKHFSSLRGLMRRKEPLLINPSDRTSEPIGKILEIKLEKTPNDKTGKKVDIPIKNSLMGGIWTAYEAMQIAMQADWQVYKKEGNYYRLNPQWKEDFEKNKIEAKENILGDKQFRDYFDSNQSLVDYLIEKGKLLIKK